MFTNSDYSLLDFFLSVGGAVIMALIFVFALFSAEILYVFARWCTRKSRRASKLFADKEDEGNCPL